MLFVVQSRVPEANRLDVVRGQALGTDCVVMRANVGMATFDRLAVTGMTQEVIVHTLAKQSPIGAMQQADMDSDAVPLC